MTVVGLTLGGSEVNGIVAIGVTREPTITSGSWLEIQVIGGRVTGVSNVRSDPPELAPTVARLDEVGSPKSTSVLLRMAGDRSAWDAVGKGDIVDVMDKGRLAADGDEVIFIRYMLDMLALLRAGALILP